MRKLITKQDVIQIQFYQMPKAFFHDPKYMAMRCETKLAYMLMLDLLPLSAANNWVNEHNEIFVKLSRTKLMRLLNIKGTQKAAQIMKELVDKKLIESKRVGHSKCNEIYLYPVDPSIPEYYETNPPKNNNTRNTRRKKEKEIDIDALHESLEEQLEAKNLKQKYDPELVDEILNNICDMYLSTSIQIQKQDKPMAVVRNVISKLKTHHIEHVIDQFKEIATTIEIVNPKRYLQTMIYNSVYEANTKIVGHIRYNFGW